MTVDPASAAVQAASLASVAKQGYLAEKQKIAQLRMVQIETVSGEEARSQHATANSTGKKAKHADHTTAPVPFTNEIAQHLQAINGAAKDAQAAAAEALVYRKQAGGGQGPISSYMASPDVELPSRTTRNGLALDYFHLDSLPAATAVRFAKREVAGAMAMPTAPSAGLRSVDEMAKQAFKQGTAIVVSRRQKAGILPMPINKGWKYSIKKVQEQVGEKVSKAQKAVAKVTSGSVAPTPVAVAGSTGTVVPAAMSVASPPKAKAKLPRTAQVVQSSAGSGDVLGRLGQLEAEVEKLKQEKAMEEKLKTLRSEEATLESKYPLLHNPHSGASGKART